MPSSIKYNYYIHMIELLTLNLKWQMEWSQLLSYPNNHFNHRLQHCHVKLFVIIQTALDYFIITLSTKNIFLI